MLFRLRCSYKALHPSLLLPQSSYHQMMGSKPLSSLQGKPGRTGTETTSLLPSRQVEAEAS
jgi:hypothetical protein